jgi:hypothetical protein
VQKTNGTTVHALAQSHIGREWSPEAKRELRVCSKWLQDVTVQLKDLEKVGDQSTQICLTKTHFAIEAAIAALEKYLEFKCPRL